MIHTINIAQIKKMEKLDCHHIVSIAYRSDSCDVVWHDFPFSPEMKSFVSTDEAWEFAVDKLREIFYEADFRDDAIDLEEQCSKCGRTPLNFIDWKQNEL
jgi:hypothetical protein